MSGWGGGGMAPAPSTISSEVHYYGIENFKFYVELSTRHYPPDRFTVVWARYAPDDSDPAR